MFLGSDSDGGGRVFLRFAMTGSAPRETLIDMVKGLACIAIVWHHLAFYGPMSDIALPLFPNLIDWLYDYGRMAVQVFLVLGGYLAAKSLAPHGWARFDHAWPQIGRRFIRLVIPYLVALTIAILIAALVRPWFDHDSVPSEPRWPQLVAHALLLQSLLDEESISAGVWYVAIDFQLFLYSVLIFSGVRVLPRLSREQAAIFGKLLIVLGVALSLVVFNRQSELDDWGIYFFGAYGLGMMACWAVQSQRPSLWVVLIASLGGLALVVDFRERIFLALMTSLGLVWALRSRWQPGAGAIATQLQRLGQCSYSVFLVHFPVCLLVNAVFHHFWPQDEVVNAAGMVLAFVLSIGAGRLMYQWVKQPAPKWGHAASWQAGLIGTGMLLVWVDV